MRLFVFTYHTDASWVPDSPRGYVKRHQGVLPPDKNAARMYRRGARHEEFGLTDDVQLLLVEEAQRASGSQNLSLHLVATESTHLHVLVSWKGERPWKRVRIALNPSCTRATRARIRESGSDADRPFFSDGASRMRIGKREHFDHWMNEYGPSHSGRKWSEERGAWK